MFKPEKDDKLGIFQHGVSVGIAQERERIIAMFKDENSSMSDTVDYYVDGYYGWKNASNSIIEEIEKS